MARFTKQELLDNVLITAKNDYNSQVDSLLPSASGLTMEQMRDGLKEAVSFGFDAIAESFRHLQDVSNADGIIFQESGDQESGQFEMTLLEDGEVGGIVVPDPNGGPDIETGYQLIPILTGSIDGGDSFYSPPFDGVIEVGPGDINDTLKIDHDGMLHVSGSFLCDPDTGQGNRQIEADICIYDSSGTAKRILGFKANVNASPGLKTSTNSLPSFTIQEGTILSGGDNIGLVVRKGSGEQATDVTFLRSFLQATYMGLAQS